jgi:hypothetical protein
VLENRLALALEAKKRCLMVVWRLERRDGRSETYGIIVVVPENP